MGRLMMYCHTRWSEGVPSNAPATKDEALARIDQLYESGVPFFTKESIRAILEQFQRPPVHGDKVFVKDLLGATVECDIKTGDTQIFREWNDDEHEYLLQEPIILYHCRAHLKHLLWMRDFDVDLADYCTLAIKHNTQEIRLGTREPVEDDRIPAREVLVEYFREQIKAWKESDMCKRLEQTLNTSAAAHEITKIVGLALGPISYNDSSNRSAFQHALLLTLRDWLLKRKGDLACYSQDPRYKSVDRSILGDYGIEVIEDPRAWLEIDEASIVFSCAPNVPVKEIVADIARPAVVIWERVGNEDYVQEGKDSCTDPCSPRVRRMVEGYQMFEFGADKQHFTETVVYIRRCRH